MKLILGFNFLRGRGLFSSDKKYYTYYYKDVQGLQESAVIQLKGLGVGKVSKIELLADRSQISADGKDLSFVTVRILDAQGNVVPDAAQLVQFKLNGPGTIAGVDNGFQASLEPFKADYRKAYRGLCLAIIQAGQTAGNLTLKASAPGLQDATVTIAVK